MTRTQSRPADPESDLPLPLPGPPVPLAQPGHRDESRREAAHGTVPAARICRTSEWPGPAGVGLGSRVRAYSGPGPPDPAWIIDRLDSES